jgi:SAM-dependent methyltransferase
MPPADFRIATDRNKHPILEVLLKVLPEKGSALEIACGTGQHAQWFAQHLPGWQWLPSDVDADALRTTDARLANSGLPNVLPAFALDVMNTSWFAGASPAPHFDSRMGFPRHSAISTLTGTCAQPIHDAVYGTCPT